MLEQTNDQVGAGTDAMLAAQITKETIAEQINETHWLCVEAKRGMVHYARSCGELLLKAKEQVGHGEWRAWLKDNFEGSARTATDYMKIAGGWDQIKSAEVADLTISNALRIAREGDAEPKVPADPLDPLLRALRKVPADANVYDVLSRIAEAVEQRFGYSVVWTTSRVDEAA